MNFIDEKWSYNDSVFEYLYNYGNIPSGWKDFFLKEDVIEEIVIISDYLLDIKCKIFPEITNIFKAFYLTPASKLNTIILGQDPYHTEGCATGICFQVPKGLPRNPSLKNIIKEYGKEPDFENWARNGVLLINTALTVEEGKPNSHAKLWANFTKLLLEYIDKNIDNITWILFGNSALNLTKNLTNKTHKKIITSHPSPFSANSRLQDYPAFLGSGVFKNLKLK